MFKQVQNPPDFPALDHELLKKWKEENIFQRSIDEREGGEDYVFYDGPPGTNGTPHVGHIMQSALKDLWPRFWTMRGKRVLRKAGWDTHGLPVEMTADKLLGIEKKQQIEEYGVQEYVDKCRSIVFQFRSEWEEAISRCGRFVDLENFYATYKTSYIQSDWWILKKAFETKVKPEYVRQANIFGKDSFLFKDYRISAWDALQGTTLSNFEVAQGYKEVEERALFPKFRVKGMENTFLVAWTTTAWTLLSNIAIAAGPKIQYVKVRITEDSKAAKAGEILIVAKARLDAVKEFFGAFDIDGSMTGEELAGLEYFPLWDWQELDGEAKGHFVIADEYVTTEDGSGLVHLAPYGEDDYRLMKNNDLPVQLNVSEKGIVEDRAGEFAGHWFKDEELEVKVIKSLAAQGLLLGKERHTHTYPFHYKTGSPLMYFPRPGWFIRATAMRDELLEANERINWYPGHIKEGRFGKWLSGVIDWNITRERFWGSPLPIWSSEDGTEAICVGSVKELSDHVVRSGGDPLPEDWDPHKPGIDNIVLISESGKELHRENFVLDSWYNAGIMPWGQIGYPASEGSVEYFNSQYPAEFICEGLDQTRGWFYSLLAVSTMLAIATGEKDKSRWSSYKNVICTDLVLDESGQKMSKSKGNVVAPVPMMDKYGADSVRWSFYKNNPWVPVRFGEEPLREALRQIFIPLWNAYSFFVTYANVDGWLPDEDQKLGEATPVDKWIMACLYDLIKNVTESLEKYDVMPASAAIADFIDRLTNWYIRRNRRRFWKSEEEADKNRAYHTLYTVLTTLSKVIAPFSPFIAEDMYLNLVKSIKAEAKDSVHLEDWPIVDESWRDDELKENMDTVRKTVTAALSARNDSRLKVRQPLANLIVVADEELRKRFENLQDLIIDELNVHEISFVNSSTDLVDYNAKGNFKALGPRFGKNVKTWVDKIVNADSSITAQWANGKSVEIDGESFGPDDVILEQIVPEHLHVKEEGDITIALDKRLNDELLDEGYARELINKVQNQRKKNDYEVTQRIRLHIKCDERLKSAFSKFNDLIAKEVLALELNLEYLDKEEDLIQINDREVWFDLQAIDN